MKQRRFRAGIRNGLSLSYDADFLIGEVNADVRRYMVRNGKVSLSSVNTTDVGRKMLTKMLGSWLDEDLVARYKNPVRNHALKQHRS